MKTTDTVEKLVQGIVSELGYELADVTFEKEQGSWVLTLFIDSEKGVTVDDCELVSRAVEPVIDEADPIEQSYYLSVSSPGLDRPLKKDKDFERQIGKPVFIKLYAPREKKKEYMGVLLRFNSDTIAIQGDRGKELEFLRKDVAQIKPHISF